MAVLEGRVRSLFRFAGVLLTLGFAPVVVEAEDSSLKLVNVLYRHGDRTPTDDFPTDKWGSFWKDGLGQLTNTGKLQQYHLGQYLRGRYGNILNKTYNREEISVRCTDVDRTLMSAYCNLAGLYPPEKEQEWDPNLIWQPIPVHTVPVEEDFLLSSDAVCPKYDELLKNWEASPEATEVMEKGKVFFDFLSNKTGHETRTIYKVSDTYDILWIQNLYNLSLPDWADNATLKKLFEYRVMDFDWSYKTDEMRRLRGGSFVGEIIKNMEEKIGGKIPAKKMFMYSAHDMTIIAVTKTLGIYNDIFPPYIATLLFELHEDNNTHSIKILYRNSTKFGNTSHEPYELKLKDCPSPCPLEKFKQLTAHMVPDDIVKECTVTAFSSNIALISAIAGSILGCTLLMLIVSAYAFYKRNSDSYRYFNVNTDTV